MKNKFEINGEFFAKNVRGKRLEINMGGGSLHDAHTELGLIAVDSIRYEVHRKHGIYNGQEDICYQDDSGNFYSRSFMHMNGHITGFKEGVYEVTFTKMIQKK
jgi:hypothetical protein